jgi:PAS domain S-box-containing protein
MLRKIIAPLVSAPHAPLARARWLFFIGGLSSAIVAVIMVTAMSLSVGRRWAAGAAILALLLYWYHGYHRQRFVPVTIAFEGLVLFGIGVLLGAPGRTLGLLYTGINFRALYGTKRHTVALFGAYTLAYAGAEMLTTRPERWSVVLPAWVLPQMLGFGLSAAVLYALGRALERQETMADALRQGEQRYHMLFESNPFPMWVFEVATRRIVDVNQAAVEHYGYTREEFIAMHLADLRPPEEVPHLEAMLVGLPALESATHLARHRKKDGTIMEIEAIGRALAPTMPGLRIVLANDVTEQLAAERGLRASEARFRSVAESLGEAILITDPAGSILYANARTADVLGAPPADLLGQSADALLFANTAHSDRPFGRHMDGGKTDGRRDVRHHEAEFHRPDGTQVWIAITLRPFIDAEGQETGTLATIADITARHRAEHDLRATNRTLRALFDLAPQAIVAVDLDRRITGWNRAAERIFGWSVDEVFGKPLPFIPPDRTDEFLGRQSAEAQERGMRGVETKRLRKDGTPIDVLLSTAVLRDASGTPNGFMAVLNDITESKRLEAQLRQAQKMEAVGQLAGGIAHDFNNLLTSIKCSTAFLLEAMERSDPRCPDVLEIDDAATRAATLTRQLLAFSRKQVLQPAVVDPNVLITDLGKMLRRLVPENITQTLQLDPDAGPVIVDPGQLEQVIINLVVNARDAMSAGGVLTIGTEDAELTAELGPWRHEAAVVPGSYVVISVSDTGCGMDRATQDRIFEPFFTTKPVGHGTGLGLSTVYGIVKQSSGYIWVYSEPGRGSTFRVYLPRGDRPAEVVAREKAPSTRGRGSERILVVEDEAAVRSVVGRLLSSQGYIVLTAANAEDALTVLGRQQGQIDLVLTDIVMPGISGPALVEQLAKHAGPDGHQMRALFMSGYTHSHIAQSNILEPGMELLEKPFTPAQLADRVRSVLDRSTVAAR